MTTISINITINAPNDSAVLVDDEDPPHDSQLDATLEGVGMSFDNPIGFHANVEADDGRYEE